MGISVGDRIVLTEKESLSIGNSTVQTLSLNETDNFYGGGTQNGRFVHTGEEINIANESGWVDGQVASPNPFYWSTAGYGVLRNTFSDGKYNFGKTDSSAVTATHNESEFDAYYFVSLSDSMSQIPQEILQDYYKVTGNPVLLPEYGFYEGHLNCYNRDAWNDGRETADPSSGNKTWETTNPDGSEFVQTEAGATGYEIKENLKEESLNGHGAEEGMEGNIPAGVTTPYQYSARAVIDRYLENDMPIGYFVPNDGYGCGYGQNGYNVTGGVEDDGTSSAARIATIDANVNNLKEFTEYANSKGIATGLWTQSQLSPTTSNDTQWHLLRDFQKEVTVGGITTLKTDVAWVGPGYSMQLDGVKTAYDIITTSEKFRPNIISLDGWAGSQRFNSVWTGDQVGGNWEYIRFHIPTYIGQSLAGNPNIGSDMDGIHGGDPLISARDYQWKAFTPQMLNMDGWGLYAKTPYTFADPYKSTARMYLKLKAQLMPYTYTSAASAANIDTGNGDTGLPMIRAMFLEYPDDSYAYSKNMQYQYMYGDSFLVAPVYQDTQKNEVGDDIRNDIYLPEGIWIDYFTGEQYRGGTVINGYDAPLWKLPLFVKNGSIVPMYEENNTPSEIDKANRIIEFWPSGSSEYTVFEDDGEYISNVQENDPEYGMIDNISYGEHASMTYTSDVSENNVATLTAQKAVGGYEGFNENKNTTFIVNVSKQPTSIVATNGNTVLDIQTVTSKDEFDAATPKDNGAVYFYDESPEIETYALESETKIQEMVADVKVSPKLYVKFAQTNAAQNVQTLVINGFANDGDLSKDEINSDLNVPTNLMVTATSFDQVSITWDEVADAATYDVMVNDIVYSLNPTNAYTAENLNYLTDYTFKVRAVNNDGYSKWSESLEVQTLDNPYRNVPDSMSVSYDNGDVPAAYAGEFKNMVDGSDTSEYSSSKAGVWNGMSFTIDMKKVYTLDKLEYVFRKDYSNGTIKKLAISYSIDGSEWTTYSDEITLDLNDENCPLGSTSLQNQNARYTTINFDEPFKARYLKIKTIETTGGFLQAYEIRPYHVDGEAGVLPGDFDMNGTINDNDEVWLNSHHPDSAGSRIGDKAYDADAPTGAKSQDLNGNGIFDVQDIAMLTTQLDGGVKEKTAASGKLIFVPSSTNVNEGDTFTIDVYGSYLENVYAFDFEMLFDKDAISTVKEDVKVEASTKTVSMNLYYNLHEPTDSNAENRVYAAFTNTGSKQSLSGDMRLARITLKANKNLDLSDLDINHSLLVGSNLGKVNAIDEIKVEAPQESEERKLSYPTEIVQAEAKSNGPSGDGDSIINSLDGDFSTYTNSNYHNPTNALPQVYTFTLDKERMISKVAVRPRSADYYNQLGSFKVFVKTASTDWSEVAGVTVSPTGADSNSFTFAKFDPVAATQIKLELEPQTADGNCVATSEVEIYQAADNVSVESIAFDEKMPAELFVGKIVPVNVVINPSDATNQLYTITSDNDAVQVIKYSDGKTYQYSLLATKPVDDEVTITAVSQADQSKSATIKVSVSDQTYQQDLDSAIDEARQLTKSLYTEASYQRLENAIAAAEVDRTGKTQDQIDQLELDIQNAIAMLEFKGSDTSRPDSTKHIDEGQMKVVGSSSIGEGANEYIIDNDPSTYWHSNYNPGYVLPQDITVDLGYTYNLEQVDYTTRHDGGVNGDITHYRIEVSTNGTDFTPVVEGTLTNNGYELTGRDKPLSIKFAPVEARYVKFIAIESIGDGGKANDLYASIGELDFYGTTDAQITSISFAQEDQNQTIYAGTTLQLNPIITPSQSTDEITWESDDSEIASVDETGLVTANAEGEVTITASISDDVKASVTITIKIADKTDLDELVSETDEYLDTVTNEEVKAYLSEEIDKAETVINNISATDEEVMNAYNALNNAKQTAEQAVAVLLDLAELNELDLSQFDPQGQEEFKALLSEALELAKDPITNLSELKEKVEETEAAKELLVVLDTTSLKNVIAVAETIDLDKYVNDENKTAFKQALASAKEIAANPSTVKEIEDAQNVLLNAEKQLKLKLTSATKESLMNIYSEFTKLDSAEYTEDSAKVITEMKQLLNTALLNDNLSEEEGSKLLNDAMQKFASLVRYADYSKVDAAIAKVPADLNGFTQESVDALKAALNAVERGKDSSQQAIVDGYATDILEAIDNLKLKESGSTNVPSKPETGDSSESVSEEIADTADTGLNSMMLSYSFSALICLAAATMLVYRKKHQSSK